MIQTAKKNCSGKVMRLCPVSTMMNVIMPQRAGRYQRRAPGLQSSRLRIFLLTLTTRGTPSD